MIGEDQIKEIKKIAGDDHVICNAMMKEYTTFKIGGSVPLICEPQTTDQAVALIRYFKNEKIEYFVMGNGSNLLVSDEGYNGAILRFGDEFAQVAPIDPVILKDYIPVDNDHIYLKVQAGARMWKVGMLALKNEAAGFEFATGIPGTVGGAVMMNAGAYGGEMKDVVSLVKVSDRDGNILVLTNDEMNFSYRKSAVSVNDYIVLEVILKLEKGDPDSIKEKIDELAQKRMSRQPLDYPSAGSTFKRPEKEGYYASAMIDQAGLKGRSIGGAKVSEKHAGFVINTGEATAKDVIELTDIIRDEVNAKTGITLELEVRKLGF